MPYPAAAGSMMLLAADLTRKEAHTADEKYVRSTMAAASSELNNIWKTTEIQVTY